MLSRNEIIHKILSSCDPRYRVMDRSTQHFRQLEFISAIQAEGWNLELLSKDYFEPQMIAADQEVGM